MYYTHLYSHVFLIKGDTKFPKLQNTIRYLIDFTSSHRRCSVKKGFLKISQKSQENAWKNLSTKISSNGMNGELVIF